jgi:hypothetical protein
MKLGIASGVLFGVLATASTAAVADEAKTPVSAAMLLNLLAPTVESRDTAFARSLRDDGPAARPTPLGEVLEDGSVRYGRAIVTVRNPCPPGAVHYELPPLPGRRDRN